MGEAVGPCASTDDLNGAGIVVDPEGVAEAAAEVTEIDEVAARLRSAHGVSGISSAIATAVAERRGRVMSDLLCHATTFYRAPRPTPITLQLDARRLSPQRGWPAGKVSCT